MLLRIKDDFGADILDDSKRLNSVLMDYVPKMRRERKVLIDAVKEGAVAALRHGLAGDMDTIKQQWTHRLVTDLWITEDAARFVVEVLVEMVG